VKAKVNVFGGRIGLQTTFEITLGTLAYPVQFNQWNRQQLVGVVVEQQKQFKILMQILLVPVHKSKNKQYVLGPGLIPS